MTYLQTHRRTQPFIVKDLQGTLTMPTAKAGIRSSPRLIRASLSSCLAIAGLRKRDKVTPLCLAFDSCELRAMGRRNINNLR